MIIVAGCSWSDVNWKCKSDLTYDCTFSKWFDQLNTDKPVKCIGKSGTGNSYMFELIVKEILSNPKITDVVWALSDWLRFNIFSHRINPQLSFALRAQSDPKYMGHRLFDDQVAAAREQNRVCDTSKMIWDSVIDSSIQTTLAAIHAVAEICENRNIKFTVFQMLTPATINQKFDYQFNNSLYTNDLFAGLEDRKNLQTMGLPWITAIGGMNGDRYIRKNEPFNRAWRVSEVDAHPNPIGHQELARWVNENITFD